MRHAFRNHVRLSFLFQYRQTLSTTTPVAICRCRRARMRRCGVGRPATPRPASPGGGRTASPLLFDGGHVKPSKVRTQIHRAKIPSENQHCPRCNEILCTLLVPVRQSLFRFNVVLIKNCVYSAEHFLLYDICVFFPANSTLNTGISINKSVLQKTQLPLRYAV